MVLTLRQFPMIRTSFSIKSIPSTHHKSGDQWLLHGNTSRVNTRVLVFLFLQVTFPFSNILIQDQLTALAIVSGNDYGTNIRGFGPANSLKILQKCEEKVDLESIVSEYVATARIQRPNETIPIDIFNSALGVFGYQREEQDTSLDETVDILNAKYLTLCAELEYLNDQRRKQFEEKKLEV